MRKIVAAAVAALVLTVPAVAEDTAALGKEGKAAIMEFGGALKGALKTALKEGGPVKAISVCNTEAPEIAAKVSASSGWTVARSSHKLRNPKNAPDAFTAAAIEDFLARQAGGEKAETMAKAGIVEEGGKRVFHLVKAIPTGEVCLDCHGGAEVNAMTEEKLAELYPQDKARGFSVGEMRGVFTLTKVLD